MYEKGDYSPRMFICHRLCTVRGGGAFPLGVSVHAQVMGADRQRLNGIAARQAGVISRRQALESGLTISALRGLVDRGQWLRVHPAIYRIAGQPPSFESRMFAAALWTHGVVSGAAAAWWWRFTDNQPLRIEVIVPPNRNIRSTDGVAVVRRHLDRQDRTHRRGLTVVDGPYAAILGAAAMGTSGRAVFDRALQLGVGLRQAAEALERNRRAAGHRVAKAWLVAADRTAAETERMFLRIMRTNRIGGWVVNHPVETPVGRFVVDFLLQDLKIAVELDGWAYHSTPERFEADRRRQNALVLAGYTVLRFTWADLVERPEQVIAEVLAAIAARKALR